MKLRNLAKQLNQHALTTVFAIAATTSIAAQDGNPLDQQPSQQQPPTQQQSQPAAQPVTTFWVGGGDDKFEDGTTITYDVELHVTQHPDGSLTADFRSTFELPNSDGSKMPIEITGQFAGGPPENEVYELRTDNLIGRANGSEANRGARLMQLRLQPDGKLRGVVGDDAEGWSYFILEQQQTPGNRQQQQPPHIDRQTNPETTPQPHLQATGDTVVFKRVSIPDPGMDNMISHHLLVPKGWKVEGGAFWRPRVYQDSVRTSLRVSAGDGRELSIYPGGNYVYTNHYAIKQQRGDVMLQPPPGPGDVTPNGFLFLPLPNSVSEYVTNIVIPYNRPEARNLQVIGVTELPELWNQVDQSLVQARQEAEQSNQQLRQMGANKQTQMSPVAERIRVSYEEHGQLFEEDVWVVGAVTYNATQYSGGGPVEEWYDWRILDPRGVRAPAGQLEAATPLLESISLSLMVDPRYAAVLMHLQHNIRMNEIKTAGRINDILREGREVAWNIYQSGVKEQQASTDRMNDSFNEYIRDVDDFRDIDGSTVNLPSLYSYVYSNGNGDYILTNEPTLDPNDGSYDRWERINPDR